MRLVIGQCRFCTVGQKNCQHYKDVHSQTKQIKASGALTHHCPAYYEVLPNGTRVKVVINEIQMAGEYEENGIQIGEYPEWTELGEFAGIVDNPTNRKGFYRIKLDHPQDVSWPDGDNWHKPKTIEITHIHKRLKEIREIDG